MDFKAIANMVNAAEIHADAMSKDRIRAIEYERGVMKDVPSEQGRSSVTSRDVRAAIKKALPSLVRTILGSDQVVEYQPVGPNDEKGAQQASDYVNLVVMQETEAATHIEAALHDALNQRNGILKWWFDEKRTAKVSTHTGIPEGALAQLTDGAEVLEASQYEAMTEAGPAVVFDVKIKRVTAENRIRIAAVPRERFLIHPDAVSLDDSPIVGEKTELTRSDLIAMGYDRDAVMAFKVAADDDYEADARRDSASDDGETDLLNEKVDYYDLFIRMDADGDGIAELHHMCFAGGLKQDNLLSDEECDDVQFCDVKVFARPHQWEGISLSDDVMEAARVKTVLLRQTLDNLYWQNNPQAVVQDGAITDLDALYNPEFGKPIHTSPGVDVRSALSYNVVPFVAQQSFGMMTYLDQQVQEWTGISDASAGLAPDALQNMTAKASAMMEAQGIGQTEMMVRTAANGLKRMFLGVLRLIIRHQDVARTVRLKGEWVQFDPRDWNAAMDCTVNTGLGAGTRERDMQMMQVVMMMQEKLLAAFGPDNPFVKPENMWNVLSKMVEAAGLKTPALYFHEPDPQEIQALMQAMKNKPSPEMVKAQAQMQLAEMNGKTTMQIEMAKAQLQAQKDEKKLAADMQAERAKMQVQTAKEQAQMQADLQVKQAERETQLLIQERELAWERERFLLEQRAALVQAGMGQTEDGQPTNPVTDKVVDMVAQIQQAMMMNSQMANRPKRIVRDENGEIVGLEAYEPGTMQ